MTLFLCNTAIPSQGVTLLRNDFILNATNNYGFLRNSYGAISPDEQYSGELLERLTLHYSSNLDQWYYVLILTGDLWIKEDVHDVSIDGVFASGSKSMNFTGVGADDFFAPSGDTYWRWNFSAESFFVGGNDYSCSITWVPLGS